jgi:hypothetical protein
MYHKKSFIHSTTRLSHSRLNNSILDDLTNRINIPFLLIVVLLIVTSISSGLFYYQTTRKQTLIDDLESEYSYLIETYHLALNTSSIISNYYNELNEYYKELEENYNELQRFYDESEQKRERIQNDYFEFENKYVSLLTEKERIQDELARAHDEIENMVNFKKQIVLETNKSITVPPKYNTTLTYSLTHAGYVELNVSSNIEIIIWIGSSITDEIYYARFPPSFPDTLTEGTMIVPAVLTTYIYILNPSEFIEAEIMLTLTFTY